MLGKILLGWCLSIFMVASEPVFAQHVEGEYVLQGNHEMVAAFKFDADSSFQFYFVYGAVDRMAKGTYKVHDGKIRLNGDKIPARDFTIRHQAQRGTGTTIRVSDKNTALQQNVLCLFIKNKYRDQAYTDQTGMAHSKLTDCDTIFVLHMLYPDVLTTVKAGPSGRDNYFELALNPSLAEVSFRNFDLTIKGGQLVCSLPHLFENEQSAFIKQ